MKQKSNCNYLNIQNEFRVKNNKENQKEENHGKNYSNRIDWLFVFYPFSDGEMHKLNITYRKIEIDRERESREQQIYRERYNNKMCSII